MQSVRYAVVPRFTVRKKGNVIDYENIEQQFTDWIRTYTEQGLVINRDTTISALIEPGCLARVLLRQKIEFADYSAIEFVPGEKATDYRYKIAPIFSVKAKKLSKKEKGKVDQIDMGLALFEGHREEFETLITDYINNIAQQGLHYNTSAAISVAIEPGCLGMLLGKSLEFVDFEAYEFVKSDTPITYKCRVFPRFKCKSKDFSVKAMEQDITDRVAAETSEGYKLTGKIIFKAFMMTGCFGKGELVLVDAFLFAK